MVLQTHFQVARVAGLSSDGLTISIDDVRVCSKGSEYGEVVFAHLMPVVPVDEISDWIHCGQFD